MEKISKKIISLTTSSTCNYIKAGLCVVFPDMSVKLIRGINYSYPEHIKSKILSLFNQTVSLKDICQLNFVIGKCYANAANILIEEFGKPDIISSQGLTIYNYPYDNSLDNISLKSIFNIGESSIIAKETGCQVISNYSETDIAYGGQGSPLESFADEKWFKTKFKKNDKYQNFAIQNIGGFSNVTTVSNDYDTFGFSNGPGTLILDYCTQKFFKQLFDINGEIASQGNICESWLDCLLQDEYYYLDPPKTIGREYFSNKYIENILKIAPSEPKDIITTLTALIAKSITQSYERFIYPNVNIDTVILGGGGVYNKTLQKLIRQYLPKYIDLKTLEDYGISNNFKDIMSFALLGYCNYYGITNNLPNCTGAEKRVILGKITC